MTYFPIYGRIESLLRKGRKMITQISDEYKVIETNVVCLFNPYSELLLHFETGCDGFSFNVKLFFETDETKEEQFVEKKVTENEFVVRFTNFDNPFGSGTSKPIELATLDGKELYMHIWIYAIGKSDRKTTARKVEYTVFMER